MSTYHIHLRTSYNNPKSIKLNQHCLGEFLTSLKTFLVINHSFFPSFAGLLFMCACFLLGQEAKHDGEQRAFV